MLPPIRTAHSQARLRGFFSSCSLKGYCSSTSDSCQATQTHPPLSIGPANHKQPPSRAFLKRLVIKGLKKSKSPGSKPEASGCLLAFFRGVHFETVWPSAELRRQIPNHPPLDSAHASNRVSVSQSCLRGWRREGHRLFRRVGRAGGARHPPSNPACGRCLGLWDQPPAGLTGKQPARIGQWPRRQVTSRPSSRPRTRPPLPGRPARQISCGPGARGRRRGPSPTRT